MIQPLKRVLIQTDQNPDICIIWLHGLGADGYDFLPVVKELEELGLSSVRYVFPHADKMPVSINGGMVMPAWYDIKHVDLQRQEDIAGIELSKQRIDQLIDEQLKQGFSSEQVFLAGFSQGGAVAYQSALRYPKKLGGLIVLSSYLIRADQVQQWAAPINRTLPIFVAHGRTDNIVPLQRGQAGAECLQQLNYPLVWKIYPMAHSLCSEEVADIAKFILHQRPHTHHHCEHC